VVSTTVIRTPDQRLRVFVSSTLGELADERAAARRAIETLRLVPVMFELGARPHPPRELYRAYLAQSQVFVGVYWQRYGWVAPGEVGSGLEDELRLAAQLPRLLYIKEPAPDREDELTRMLGLVGDRDSYKRFGSLQELEDLVSADLAILLSERFAATGTAVAASPRSTVPLPLGSIVGREPELAALRAELAAGVRLVTITGTGGVGKTRLALELARQVGDAYPDGVHLVRLETVTRADQVLPALAARLGVPVTGELDPVETVSRHLEARRMLLVLDNLEQIADVSQVVVAVLERCPDLQVVATSRRPLGVPGERRRPLAPLRIPAAGTPDVDEAPAVALFVDRAREVDPAFSLDAVGWDAVRELCRRLDGLPLAIELAAARTRLLPPEALLARLTERLDLLQAGSERPERHRTLRATIDWSANLLSERQLRLFARLSVFHDGCTIAAAQHVCAEPDVGDVLEDLGHLLDHGLVVVADDPEDDEPRIRLLEPVRADALDRLRDPTERTDLRLRHLTWYADLADRAQPFLCGPDQVRWLARVDPERANLRAAAATGQEHGRTAQVLEMAWDLYIYFHLRGAKQEPEAWVRWAASRSDDLDERQRAIAATALAVSDLWRGEITAVGPRLQRAREVFAAGGHGFETAVADMHLGLLALERAAWEEAAGHERRAIRGFAANEHAWGVGSSENLLGMALSMDGRPDEARSCYERARQAGEAIGNESILAEAHLHLASGDLERGDTPSARHHLVAAIPAVLRARDAVAAAGCLEVTAAFAFATHEPRSAVEAFTVARATRERLASPANPALRHRVEALTAHAAAAGDPGRDSARAVAARTDTFDLLRTLTTRLELSDDPAGVSAVRDAGP
jgi:predicted ATPase